jgi:hypothetical protein
MGAGTLGRWPVLLALTTGWAMGLIVIGLIVLLWR